MSRFDDRREAVTTIGQEAAGMLVALMEWNASSTADVMDRVLEMERFDRDRWKARALKAERHLAFVEIRIMGLLAPPPTSWDPDDLRP